MAISAKVLLKWLTRRLRERSTYAGLGMVAAAVGLPQIAEHIDKAGQIAMIVLGSGLMAATTKSGLDDFLNPR